MSKIDLPLVLAQADQLPAVSHSAIELVGLLADDDIDLRVVSEKVRLDPTIAGRVLKVANSSFFNRGRQIGTISDAVMVIGMTNARSLIIAAAVMGKAQNPCVPGFDASNFWRHSLSTAVVAQELAQHLGQNPGLAFSTGLLHDLGKLILALAWPQDYGHVIALCKQENLRGFEAEYEVFGLDHSAIGAGVLGDWNLPKEMVQAISEHHQMEACSDMLSSILRLANSTADYAMSPELPPPEADELITVHSPLEDGELEDMLPKWQEQYKRYSLIF